MSADDVLRAYADRHHPHAEGVALHVDYGTGVEYDAICAGCGASWVDDEGGCTERAQLLADAQRLTRFHGSPPETQFRVADALLAAHALRDAAESMTFDRVAWRELTALLVAVDLLDGRDVDAEGREVLEQVLAEWAGRT